MSINFMNICHFISMIISLAYPPKHLLEEARPITTTKRVGSTPSLFRYIFLRCTFAGVMSVVTKVIVEAYAYVLPTEFEVIEDFVEHCRLLCSDLCRDFVLYLTGKRIRGGENSSPELYFPLELPQDVMGEIGKRLESRLDILWFRLVCKRWRSSLPYPTRFPLLVPPPPDCDPRVSYFITEVTIYEFKGKSKHHGVEFEEMDNWDGKFKGIYCYTHNKKCDKPMAWFIDRRRSEISFHCKGHRLRKGLLRPYSDQERVGGRWDLASENVINKMVLISSNGADEGVNPSYARMSDMSVVALLSSEGMKGRLALLRLQGPPENWHWDTDFCTRVFKAIGTYRGQLCTLDQLGQVFSVDYHSLEMTQLGPPLTFLQPSFPLPELCTPTYRYPQKELFEHRGLLHAFDAEQVWINNDCSAYTLSLQHNKWIVLVKPARKRGYRIYFVS